jgi:hypothetical protein
MTFYATNHLWKSERSSISILCKILAQYELKLTSANF